MFISVFFDQNVKTHVVPSSMASAINDDIYARFVAQPTGDSQVNTFTIDHHGACLIERSYEKFYIDGLTVSIPSDYAMEITDRIVNADEREVNGQKYYKIHSAMACLVLTPSQYQQLRCLFLDQLNGIIERGTVEKAKFIGALQSLDGHPNIKVDVPKLKCEN